MRQIKLVDGRTSPVFLTRVRSEGLDMYDQDRKLGFGKRLRTCQLSIELEEGEDNPKFEHLLHAKIWEAFENKEIWRKT
jgi:hypothetical protein